MQEMNLLVLVIWAVAGLSLLAMVLVVLLAPKNKTELGARPAPGVDGSDINGAAAGLSTWKSPSLADLDGILTDPGTKTRRSGSLGETRRKKMNGPVSMQQRIVRAGIYRKGGMRTFHMSRALVTITLLVLGGFVSFWLGLPTEITLAAGAFGGVAGYLAPSFWLDRQLRKRQIQMRRALPDALDLITVCLQGGISLPASLSRVARELGPAHPMLATELAIVEREIQMGRDTGNALFQMAQRFNLEELRSLSSVVGQTEKYGGAIASALRDYAESLRIRRRQQAEERAQKAAVKLLFPTLLCIFPGIFVVVLGPTAIRMLEVMAGVSWSG